MKSNHIKTHSLRALSIVGALALSGTALAGDDKWEKMDSNHDGMISAQEHTAAANAMFQKLDADGDGRVTAAEMRAGREGDDDRGKSHADKLQKMDTDGDGAVSAQEHAAAAQSKHGMLDTDGDGSISQAEFEAKKDMKGMDHDRDMDSRDMDDDR